MRIRSDPDSLSIAIVLLDGEFKRRKKFAAPLAAVAGDLVADHGAHGIDVGLKGFDSAVVFAAAPAGGIAEHLAQGVDQRAAENPALAPQFVGEQLELLEILAPRAGVLLGYVAKIAQIPQTGAHSLREIQGSSLQFSSACSRRTIVI